jgi:hypothetical protein
MESDEMLPIQPPTPKPLIPVILTGLLAGLSVVGWFLTCYGIPIPTDDLLLAEYVLVSVAAFLCCILFLGALTQYFGFTKEELNKIGDDALKGKPPI